MWYIWFATKFVKLYQALLYISSSFLTRTENSRIGDLPRPCYCNTNYYIDLDTWISLLYFQESEQNSEELEKLRKELEEQKESNDKMKDELDSLKKEVKLM